MRDVFNDVSKCRNPHHHADMQFIDSDLIDSEMASILLRENNTPIRFKQFFLDKLKKQESESFKKAEIKWTKIARNNNNQISGLIDEVFKRNKEYIYKVLKIRPFRETLGNIKVHL